ncbi:MAG: DUF2207 domain-containing protein, partial [Clostridiales bacterium]|nr:DUF2207 domain-containing protein [Clostridiales bacterium]
GIYVDIPVNSAEKVRDLHVSTFPVRGVSLSHEELNKIVRARVGDEDKLFSPGQTLNCVVTYDYITPEHKYGPDVLAFMAVGQGWTCVSENVKVTMTFPAAPDFGAGDDYGVWVAGDKTSDVEWSNDGKTLTVKAASLDAFEGIEMAYKMPDGTLKDYNGTEYLWAIIIGIILLVLTLVFQLFVAKNKPLTPIVDYYPPRVGGGDEDDYFDPPGTHKLKIRRMLPVQMGKIIDDSCSGSDVTSLIFYWASNGFLSIEERDGNTYLIKEHELDSITAYEAKLFNRLFARAAVNADGKPEVSVESLSGSFGEYITDCKTAVNAEYSGKFYKSGFNALSRAMTVLCALYGVLFAIFSTLRIGFFLLNLFGLVALIPAVLSAVIGNILAKHYYKLTKNKRTALVVGFTVLTVALSIASSLVIPFDTMGWPERIVFALCLGVSSAIAPFLIVRKPEYNEQLNAVLGFRDFLRDAEKDRLETMLAEDPQYYYNILPYANVLGVSSIWADKFKDMTIEPPTYYRSARPDLFDIWVVSRLTRSVGSSLTYTPPKVN